MKWRAQHLALGLIASLAIWAQPGQCAGQSAPQGQNQPREERPTLGPRTGPAVGSAPDTSTTTDVRKLMRIHTLYIESIDNSLSDKLVEALGKWGRFRLVTKPTEADATLRGSCLESRRLKHVHSEVFISDRTGASVWQDAIYRPFNPPGLDQAVSDTATLVTTHLEESVRQAESR